jgi:hypothetical protein
MPCLSDFIATVFTARCVQWRRRLDLAKMMSSRGFERSGGGGEKVSREVLGSPSQPYICEGWVSWLFSKLITDRRGRSNPRRVQVRLDLLLRVFAVYAKSWLLGHASWLYSWALIILSTGLYLGLKPHRPKMRTRWIIPSSIAHRHLRFNDKIPSCEYTGIITDIQIRLMIIYQRRFTVMSGVFPNRRVIHLRVR